MSDAQTSPISLRFPTALKNKLQEQAAIDRRTLTDLVIAITSCWLDGRTYQPLARLAKPAKEKPAFIRPPGRPARPNESLRAQWLIPSIEAGLFDQTEVTLEDAYYLATGNKLSDQVQNFDVVFAAQLVLLGWQKMTPADKPDTFVWLSPEHPFFCNPVTE
ncbi:hypothetical protein D3Y57_07010 [Sphingomonas paeninsulae]|uniref:Uncharacterized protein n=1 Tax=Sphingomonas paeninsulae TaxID=2319844 RepID=A0A494T8U5_SPHPE|nr:hypothetical protein [Sphingomonas paeninsulae]AYJ85767.1 hypothetical protein D3Y57_07010 [Sphingomonas paeninsulae]